MQVNNKQWLAYVLFVICLITRLVFFGRYIDDWDGVNFVFGLTEGYDVFHDQPHFHGYPVYMFVSWIIYLICDSAISSLVLAGIIFSSLAVFPLYALARRMFSWQIAVVALVLYILNPQVWLQAEKTLSDGFGLFFVVTFTYFFYRSIEESSSIDGEGAKSSCNCQSLTWLFLGSLTLGLGIGVRISYMAFIVVWGFATFMVCRKVSVKNGILYSFTGFGLGVLVWFSYLLGCFGLAAFFDKFTKHSDYHFSEPGYSILASTDYFGRFITLSKNIFAHSFGTWWIDNPLIRLLPTVFMIIGIVAYITTEKLDLKNKFLLISIGAYVAWLVVVQSAIRQTMVLVPFVVLIIAAGIFYFFNKVQTGNKKRKWLIPLVFFLFFVPMAFDSGRLAWINCNVEPPQVAMANYIADNYEKEDTKYYCLNTWRLFQYYAPEWRDKGNNHLYFTSSMSKVAKDLAKRNPNPENVLISSKIYERHKYKRRLRMVKVFERDRYAVAEYNWIGLYEFDARGL